MGQSKSKGLKYPQYSLPPGYPQYPTVYQYPVIPQVAYPPGYHAPVIPPGYGPLPVVIPQPPGKSRSKKKQKHASFSGGKTDRSTSHRRHRSAPMNVQPAPAGMFENLPPGFVVQSVIPNLPGGTNPVIPPAAQGDHPPPLFTGVSNAATLISFPSSGPPTHRAPTPWVSSMPSDTSDEEDESQQRTSYHRSRSLPHRHTRSASRYRREPRREILPEDPEAALDARQPNPLPVPPRDLFANSPYRHLLPVPDAAALLSTTTQNPNVGYDPSNTTVSRSVTLPGIAGVGAGVNAVRPTTKKKRGLFSSFGSRRSRRDQSAAPESIPEHTPGYVQPVYPNTSLSRSAAGHGPIARFNDSQGVFSPPAVRAPPMDEDESSDEEHPPPAAHRTTPGPPHPHPQPPGPSFPQNHSSQSYPVLSSSQPFLFSPNGSTIEFSQRSLPEFLNHSPHRVLHGNKTYPTAMHLHEAMKFIEHKPDLAESIRQCERIEDVYPTALNFQVWVRPDWGAVFLDKMKDVLWAKFTQHPDIRSTLLRTGDCRIVYADTQDTYWGSGSDIGHPGDYTGGNHLGKLLEEVRERLRMEGYSA